MKRKTIFAIILSIAIFLLSTTCFAVDDNVVGGVAGGTIDGTANVAHDIATGTANVVGDAARGTGEAVEGLVNGTENVVKDTAGGIREGMNDMHENMQNMSNDSLRSTTTNEYNATSRDYGAPNTFMGMTVSTWWWIILGAIAVLSIVLIMNYAGNKTDNDRE